MFTLNCKGRLLAIREPIVMGIINATPDSFFRGSRRESVLDALETAENMLAQGAAILDIGGQSTRPGSKPLTAEDELKRVLPVVDAINRRFPEAFISIDTYHAMVAREAVSAGAVIVNDISGGSFDEAMLDTVASLHTPYVCMHNKGNPEQMHSITPYEDVTREVLDYFIAKKAICLEKGITDLIIDPGFGFSKTADLNFQLLKQLEVFSVLEKPLLIGVSRKSTIYKTLGITAEKALNGTTVLHTAALLKGAAILRVHDVREAMEAITLTNRLK
ncbi:MAG: dihydropteroate synthase [Bacteroidota bacterium]|nr:dihydropteroate synthase [Bacteroidota bacterium]